MYLYIVEMIDPDFEPTFFGPFRSEANATSWAENEHGGDGYEFVVYPLLDPHYIND